ncbi:Uracil phosphoribosyltransferase [Phytophthora cinnamomi]|uniref:Uracil phosphoribosyltransferase n=1 Tax=Phytophthora cinnamomi TaxID=4785 RepID=UPI00355987AB|nr:Uracil phosphoribosyltransferase [Phytophthora cinnamomi]
MNSSPSPILHQPESPVEKSEYHMYLHARQPFIRYENVRRRPTGRIPSQGHVAKLPGVATLLRRHDAMQAKGLIASTPVPIPDPDSDFKTHHSPDTNNTFECWTPSRFAGTSSEVTSPESQWMPSTAARDQLNNGASNTYQYESKINVQAHENWAAASKSSSSVVRSPEPVRSESRPKTSRYLREIDRRRILLRIAQGEKQSALAKEYHVSRAAICNLNKHRAEVLSRNHEHPLAKHPKRRMLSKPKRNDVMDNQASASDSSSR